MNNKKGILVILSGPSGVGKDSVLDELKKIYDISVCRTATTRQMRENETNGVDYDFFSKAEFEKRISENYFLEYAYIHGNYYGTPKTNVDDLISTGNNVVLKIDVQGAFSVRKIMPEAVSIFIMPPNMDVLEERLLGRNSENEETAAIRLKNAVYEIEHSKFYDYKVINDNLYTAVLEVRNILIDESRKANK